MATYASASGTTSRIGESTRDYRTVAASVVDPGVLTRDGYAIKQSAYAQVGVAHRTYEVGRPEGGAGSATRPLTGLLHPPDRRGNRA